MIPNEPSPELLDDLVKATPSRRMVRRRCADCGREWTQPAATGRCPSCHGDRVENLYECVSAHNRV